jgi:hypothetical protein
MQIAVRKERGEARNKVKGVVGRRLARKHFSSNFSGSFPLGNKDPVCRSNRFRWQDSGHGSESTLTTCTCHRPVWRETYFRSWRGQSSTRDFKGTSWLDRPVRHPRMWLRLFYRHPSFEQVFLKERRQQVQIHVHLPLWLRTTAICMALLTMLMLKFLPKQVGTSEIWRFCAE